MSLRVVGKTALELESELEPHMLPCALPFVVETAEIRTSVAGAAARQTLLPQAAARLGLW